MATLIEPREDGVVRRTVKDMGTPPVREIVRQIARTWQVGSVETRESPLEVETFAVPEKSLRCLGKNHQRIEILSIFLIGRQSFVPKKRRHYYLLDDNGAQIERITVEEASAAALEESLTEEINQEVHLLLTYNTVGMYCMGSYCTFLTVCT